MTTEDNRNGTAPRTQANGAPAGQWIPLPQALSLAEQHRRAGRLNDAERLCRQILQVRPANPAALHTLALVRHFRGDPAEAIRLLGQAIAADGSVATYHSNLGEICRMSGRLDEAVAAGLRATELKPDYAAAHNNLGIARYDLGERDEAIACYRRAIALKPDFAEAHNNLGNALRNLGKFSQAVPAYAHAIALRPAYADAYANLGSTLHLLGRYEEAMSDFSRALALNPDQGNAHSGRGITLLLEGRYEEGWPEYEWRWRSNEMGQRRVPGRRWQGGDLAGKRIYIHAEQGLGDSIQFCRYLPLLRGHGAFPLFRLPPPLAPLIRQSMPWLDVSSEAGPLPDYDCHSPLMSLPNALGTRLDSIPADVPYLQAGTEASARWKGILVTRGRLKVGIAWAGSPTHTNDLNRSVGLETLAPLFDIDGASFFSLQVGKRAADAGLSTSGSLMRLDSRLTDFAETAAAVDNLDLVITVDTSVAHLAGAMAKPVWLLVARVPDWRWLLEREDSPWYPTMRLFRQEQAGRWEDVVARLAQELALVVGGERDRLTPVHLKR